MTNSEEYPRFLTFVAYFLVFRFFVRVHLLIRHILQTKEALDYLLFLSTLTGRLEDTVSSLWQ